MGGLATGGGTSAVAASAHAGCPRFRDTDPLLTGMSRRKLAADLGSPDPQVGIPEARWTRAMTFEAQVRSDTFASELVTKTVGQLGLPRPAAVRRRHGGGTAAATAKELAQAHLAATYRDEATLISQLAIPFYGLEGNPKATPVLPDFAVVCPRPNVSGGVDGSWLIIGDAKDYERVRARIDDGRMLKGFLQVALGAESADQWTVLPDDMQVHSFGVLAVPRNAFLQPEAVVENLGDHRSEVRATAERRLEAITTGDEVTDLGGYVHSLDAVFDPAACASCSLQNLCRSELRNSHDPYDVLIEIGVEPADRPAMREVVDSSGGADIGTATFEPGRRTSRAANVAATVTGVAVGNDRGRTDPVGEPGTINVVIAKSDDGALALHGIAVQPVIDPSAPRPWAVHVFESPLAAATRTSAMALLGQAIDEVIASVGIPAHLVTPDSVTADVLVSIADSLAGVELSRLRWARDEQMDRPALNFEGEPAAIPHRLGAAARLAVSFLLEEDRSRAMSLRHPVVDLRKVIATHVTAGGPGVDSGRLDYLVAWAAATGPLDHRALSDEIAASACTPGARLANFTSDAIHRAAGDPGQRDQLIEDEIAYKIGVVETASQVLAGLRVSPLRDVHRTLERDAQEVWQRRVLLEASDLVRFSRTSHVWRNSHVDLLDADRAAAVHLKALADAQAANDMAADAGVRQVAVARVVGVDPIRLVVGSRRISETTTIVALHHNQTPLVEASSVSCLTQAGSFKFRGMSVAPLTRDDDDPAGWLTWNPSVPPDVAVDDELVVADAEWFGTIFTSGQEIAVERPSADTQSAPKATCTPDSFTLDPEGHRWCCRPHTAVEAEWSDELAARRSRGELNPQAWPPLIDEERFDASGASPPSAVTDGPPIELGIDDLD